MESVSRMRQRSRSPSKRGGEVHHRQLSVATDLADCIHVHGERLVAFLDVDFETHWVTEWNRGDEHDAFCVV